MRHHTIVPIKPRMAPIRFHDLSLSEALALIQQLGFSEVVMLGPDEFFATVIVDSAGAVHVADHSMSTWPDIPPPSEIN